MHDLKGRSANDPMFVCHDEMVRAGNEAAHIKFDHIPICHLMLDTYRTPKLVHERLTAPPVQCMRRLNPQFLASWIRE